MSSRSLTFFVRFCFSPENNHFQFRIKSPFADRPISCSPHLFVEHLKQHSHRNGRELLEAGGHSAIVVRDSKLVNLTLMFSEHHISSCRIVDGWFPDNFKDGCWMPNLCWMDDRSRVSG